MTKRQLGTATRVLNNRIKKLSKVTEIYENFGIEEIDWVKDKYLDISDYTDEANIFRDRILEAYEFCGSFNGYQCQ